VLHKKDGPQWLAKVAYSLSAEVLEWDEFETLTQAKKYMAASMCVPDRLKFLAISMAGEWKRK
jgi:hypothetical protein